MKIRFRIKNFFSRHFSPTRIFVLSFAGVIITGAILLWFPFSATQGNLRFVDALFTSTSAVCVTGLVVIDVGKDLTTLGQVITIFLISNRRIGYHHLLYDLLRLNGSWALFQGKRNCPINLSPYASKRFHCDSQNGPLVYLHYRIPWNPLSLHPIFHGFPNWDSPLSCCL